MNEFNNFVVELLGTSLLVLLAIEMLARVCINTWFEIKKLLKREEEA